MYRKKRQKTKDARRQVSHQANADLDAAWEKKAEAAKLWRLSLPNEKGLASDLLVSTLNLVRKADRRPLLTPEQVNLFPQNSELHLFLLGVFLAPLPWDAPKFPDTQG
jgi:hypothetical protein